MKSKENKKEYDLIFKMPLEITQPFIIEMLTKGGYNKFLYIYEKGNPDTEMYLSRKSQKILGKTGLVLFSNKQKIENLRKKEKHFAKQIDDFLPTISLGKIKNSNSAWVINKLVSFYQCFADYCKIYHFTEVFCLPLVDQTIRDFVTKNIKNKKSVNRTLGVLLNPSTKKNITKEREKLLSRLKADKKIVHLCESVRRIGKEKLSMRNKINNYWSFFESFLDEVAKRLFLSPTQAKSLFCSELVKILSTKEENVDDNFLDKANRRSLFFVAKKENAKYYFYTDQKARKIASAVRKEIDKDITTISGDVASVGHAKGRVVVMPIGIGQEGKTKLKQKIALMKKGDILVAPTTGPEMIMACRKAAAIVAEEGGINSHAAIISRELEVPGIVNTKIATKVLKDGDLVEIDTKKGTIKILKKYER